MDFMKKEWKAFVMTICLVIIIIFLGKVNNQLTVLQKQNAKIISTFDSIESVAISTDAGVNEMSKNVDKIENNVTYLVKKARRR